MEMDLINHLEEESVFYLNSIGKSFRSQEALSGLKCKDYSLY